MKERGNRKHRKSSKIELKKKFEKYHVPDSNKRRTCGPLSPAFFHISKQSVTSALMTMALSPASLKVAACVYNSQFSGEPFSKD